MRTSKVETVIYLGLALGAAGLVGMVLLNHFQSRDPQRVLNKVKKIVGVENLELSFVDQHSYALSSDARYFVGTLRADGPEPTLISTIVDLKLKRPVWRVDGPYLTNILFTPALERVVFIANSRVAESVQGKPVYPWTGPVVVETDSAKTFDLFGGMVRMPEGPPTIQLNWRGETELEYRETLPDGSEICHFDLTKPPAACQLRTSDYESEFRIEFRPTESRNIQQSFLSMERQIRASQNSANESRALGILRTFNTALVTYAFTYPDVGFPIHLGQLRSPGNDCSAAGLLDRTLAEDTFQNSGYEFEYTLMVGGGHCPARNETPGTQYVILASPTIPGRTGSRYFVTDSSAVIYVGATREEAVSRRKVL